MKQRLVMFLIIVLAIDLVGCDAFVRKFTRKSKKDKIPEELVLAPEEYKPPLRSPEEIYRGYFLFWKAWHDELLNALSQETASQKKRIDCAQEAIKNLSNMRDMLGVSSRKKLDKYVIQLQGLCDSLKKDLYGADVSRFFSSAERIKLSIVQDFSYAKIRNDIK